MHCSLYKFEPEETIVLKGRIKANVSCKQLVISTERSHKPFYIANDGVNNRELGNL